MQKAVDRLKNNKSPGVDGIQAELVKAGGESTVDAIHRLCNMVWDQERWPTEWTSSILVTIAKRDNTHRTHLACRQSASAYNSEQAYCHTGTDDE